MGVRNRSDSGPSGFPATRESLIQAVVATDPEASRRACDVLIETYWKPVYKYLRVIRRFEHDDAEDLTQDFFAHALAKDTLRGYRFEKGRFRTYLRVCLDRFAANAIKGRNRQKRGGGLQRISFDKEAVEAGIAGDLKFAGLDPEEYFRREWIRVLFERGLEALTLDYRSGGKAVQLEVFLAADVDPKDGGRASYQDLADRFRISVSQVTNYLAAARRAFRRAALAELRESCGTDREFREEARDLLGVDPE